MRTVDALSAALRGLVAAALLACSGDRPPAQAPVSPAPTAPSAPPAGTATSNAAAAPAPATGVDADAEDEDAEDPLREGVAPKSGGPKVPPELVDRWELKQVRYKDGRKPFVPKLHGGFTLSTDGLFRWTDGCNYLSMLARAEAGKITLGPEVTSSLLGCNFTVEDVHYGRATYYRLEKRTLYLHTPSQIYVLERFPYSRLSAHGWSLHSIKDRQSGAVLTLDRFRTEGHALRLRIEKDSAFHFTDLDRDTFTGSLKVEGGAIRGMAYDHASKERLRNKPVRWGHLKDTTRDYRQTKKKYPTTVAHQIDWEAVTSFKVYEGTVKRGSEAWETEILELVSDRQIYRFIPR
ncbi:hypothetical protein [Sorangium sp. So ce341]|uniref:hypothetical protein n=1 Tax=Sorangium sp. So ce341 TaxID=3133302 RepID=UPI003F6127D0